MELPNIRQLKDDAAYALRRGREPRVLVLWYAGASALLAATLTLLNYALGTRISSTGGLSGMGTRSMLSTIQMVLPMVQTVVLSCLELGYLHGMMRICRGQYADQTDLKTGFDKLAPLIRLILLQGILIFGAGFFTYQAAMTIYLFTPWAETMMELMLPLTQDMSILDSGLVLTDEFLAQAAPAVMPMLVIWMVLLCAVAIPLGYRLRMSSMALLDEPRGSAFAALRASMKMTRRNCWKLFRLDLSFWWYYGLTLLAGIVSYLDGLLPMVGISLPINGVLAFFLFYGLYLAATFAISYFFLNRVQATYVVAYESLREKPKDNGVVLGNIFDV